MNEYMNERFSGIMSRFLENTDNLCMYLFLTESPDALSETGKATSFTGWSFEPSESCVNNLSDRYAHSP